MALDPYSIISPLHWVLIAALASAAYWLLTKTLLKKEVSNSALAFINPLFSIPFFIIAILAFGGNIGFSSNFDIFRVQPIAFVFAALSGTFTAAAMFFLYKSMKEIDVSDASVINQSRIIFTAIIAWIFLSEPLGPQRIFAILLICAGAILCSWRYHRIKLAFEGVALAFLAAFFVAASNIFDKAGLAYMPPLLFAVFSGIFMMLALIIRERKILAQSLSAIKRHYIHLIPYGFLISLTYGAFLMGLARLDASVVVPVYALRVVLTSFGGIFIMKEKSSVWLKVLGAAAVFAGVILIS